MKRAAVVLVLTAALASMTLNLFLFIRVEALMFGWRDLAFPRQ